MPRIDDLKLEGFETAQFKEQASITLKIFKLLEEKFDCEHPAKALIQIKRKIKAGLAHQITSAKIRQWGK